MPVLILSRNKAYDTAAAALATCISDYADKWVLWPMPNLLIGAHNTNTLHAPKPQPLVQHRKQRIGVITGSSKVLDCIV